MIHILYIENEYQDCPYITETVFRLRRTIKDGVISNLVTKSVELDPSMMGFGYEEALEEAEFSVHQTENSKELIVSVMPYNTSHILKIITNFLYREDSIGEIELVTIINYSEGDDFHSDYLKWLEEKGIEYRYIEAL